MGAIAAARSGVVYLGDNLPLLKQEVAAESVALIYIDPPFNSGRIQRRTRIRTTAVDATAPAAPAASRGGLRGGFGGRRYRVERADSAAAFADAFGSSSAFLNFLAPRLAAGWRTLRANGSLFFHIDWREAARCRLLLEGIFRAGGNAARMSAAELIARGLADGETHCLNEIIWAYDFGARAKTRWPAKHDTIFWFAKNPRDYVFNYEALDRIPYLAPGLQSAARAKLGKTPTDVWWQTIVPTNGAEKTGYPTQKPLAIAERIIKAHSDPGDLVLDFFAGSGTLGEAAAKHGRRFILMDENPAAAAVMKKRFAGRGGISYFNCAPRAIAA